MYLSNLKALPSTSKMVQRAVKKAKLCQKNGKGERNVTAYGTAGDGVKKTFTEQLVPTSYPVRMNERRKDQQQRAEDDGRRDPRSKKDYKEDLTRGPSCIQTHSQPSPVGSP
jgi:basic membrane lipoprotein Med (substrate-binding protein (PBP1-ABC) superfamily)